MKIALFSVLIGIVIVFLIFTIIDILEFKLIINKTLMIEKGTPVNQIAQKLEKKGIIHSATLFVTINKIINLGKTLHFGKFYFSGKYNIFDVISKLSQADIIFNKVTVPEGYTVRKIGRLFSNRDLVDYMVFDSLTKDTVFISKLQLPVGNLEGFLFPDTYFIPYYADEEDIIKMMVSNFFIHWNEIEYAEIEFDSLYSVLILASIVEREAIYDDERALIAGVYINRLNNNMLLQADPTIAYALELKNRTRRKIYYQDLRINSIYNTYKHKGLPPTPICNPGLESILAALYPENSDYYFFFAGEDSRHIFSKTYYSHLRKLNRI